jgi:tripartite-type tricarboxylate transporter receptor subunit TctC
MEKTVMLRILMGSLACLTICANAYAQTPSAWPNRPVRIIVPFTSGSFTDIAARALAKELATQLNQPFVVENRVGAGGTIGVEAVAKSSPDGYTLLFAENSFAIAPGLYPSLPYDSNKDITPIAQLAEVPAVFIARKDFPFSDLKSIVQQAKKQPGTINYGSAGQGTSSHLGIEAFLLQTGTKMTHIPYKGISAALIDLVGGRIDLAMGSAGTTGAYIKDGRVKGIALSGNARHPMFPQVPTFAEQGYGDYSFMYWFGVMAPSQVPPDIAARIEAAVVRSSQQPELKKVLEAAGVEPKALSSAAFAKRVRDETALWKRVIQESNVKPE